jgi:hypothetical protein
VQLPPETTIVGFRSSQIKTAQDIITNGGKPVPTSCYCCNQIKKSPSNLSEVNHSPHEKTGIHLSNLRQQSQALPIDRKPQV